MSPSAAAIAIGIKKSNVTYWKNGRNNPSDVTLSKIANFFGVTVEELMGETDGPSAGIKKERPADGEARVCDLPESIQKIINICLDRPELASALLTLAQQIEKG